MNIKFPTIFSWELIIFESLWRKSLLKRNNSKLSNFNIYNILRVPFWVKHASHLSLQICFKNHKKTFFSLINSAVVRTIIFPSTVGPIKAQMNRKTTLNIKPLSFKLFIETIKVQIWENCVIMIKKTHEYSFIYIHTKMLLANYTLI